MGRFRRPYAISIALIFASVLTPSARQQLPPQADLARRLQDAERLEKERKLDEAITAFRAAIDAAHAAGFPAEEAQAQCGLGLSLLNQSRYADARPPLEQCLEIAERMHSDSGIARAANSLSRVAEMTGRYADGLALVKRAIVAADATGDPTQRAVTRLQLLHIDGLPIEEERSLSDRIIADARLANDLALEANALHVIGDRLFTVNRYEEAFDALTRARDLYHAAGAFGDEGTTLNSLGRVYRAHGRMDEALKCQLQALALHEKYGTPFELMQSHNAVAVVADALGDSRTAREHYERALALARLSGSPRIQDFLNANLAGLLISQGEYEKGARSLEDVIAHGLDAYPSVRYANLSDAYLKLNRPADAMTAAMRALDTCGDNQAQCLGALERRAAAYGALNNDAAARADVRDALDRIERLRTKLVPADFLKQNFHQAQQAVYSAAIAIAFKHHDDHEALETAELASSRALLDLLAARRQQDPDVASDPGGATVRGRDLVTQTTGMSAKTDDVVSIARRLHSTAVVYWPSEYGLFIWIVNRDGRVVSRRVDISMARLNELIAATAAVERTPAEQQTPRPAMVTRGVAQISGTSPEHEPWQQLYEVLVTPIRGQLPRAPGSLLTIIPHGALMNVSFAALQNRKGRYLLEDYAIHYAPAAAVLQFTAGMRHAEARSGNALLVADPVTVRRSPLDPALPPLPGARDEVARIAGLIPRGRLTLLQGRDATATRVTASAPRQSILHLATHAIIRDDAPEDSYLAFAPGDSGSGKTGLVTAHDVYDLRLKADLVVLSACRSGGGRVTGDGIAAFARAFMYAGTPSLVLSLWDVADEPTSRLLPDFYRTWLAGSSKARSLRRAQLKLLADLRAGSVRVDTKAGPIVLPEHPAFWAGFVLIGEPE